MGRLAPSQRWAAATARQGVEFALLGGFAAPGRLQGEVLVQAAAVTGVGLALGVSGALGLTRLMASLPYGVEPTDPATFAAWWPSWPPWRW